MKLPHATQLTGKTAAITGGGGVLCGCMARALGGAGAQVAVLDLRDEAAAAVADQIVDRGRPCPRLRLRRAGSR